MTLAEAIILIEQGKTPTHYIGEIVHHGEHECVVTDVWYYDGKYGITIKPTGNCNIEIDVYEELL